MQKVCLGYGHLFTGSGSRCPDHTIVAEQDRDRMRGTRQARGYDANHDRARLVIRRLLPAKCGYCPRLVRETDPWVAAHVVDGDPSYGWMAAHNDCNERAKQHAFRAVRV